MQQIVNAHVYVSGGVFVTTPSVLCCAQSQDMGGAGLGLQGAVSRFKKVMEEPQQRRIFSMVIGGVVVLFILYLLTRRRPA